MYSEPALHFLDLYIRKLQSKSNNWRRKEPMGGNCDRKCRAHMKWISKSRQANLKDHIYLLSIPDEFKKIRSQGDVRTLAERNPGVLHCLIREISDRKKANVKAVPPEDTRHDA
jgi:hypothetical protein